MQKHVFAFLFVLFLALLQQHAEADTLQVQPRDSEPKSPAAITKVAFQVLQGAVQNNANDRRARFSLVRALMQSKRWEEAKKAAIDWRQNDAYNLVVVRLLGDIYSELGDKEQALRVYSAVVELLPKDPRAQRALASVLKQNGHKKAARQRLEAAVALRTDDLRLRFELADITHRLGDHKKSQILFESIANHPNSPELLRYPAKERLAQIYGVQLRDAKKKGDSEGEKQLQQRLTLLKLKGGHKNDIKVYLTWDTDRSDVDLWVTNPAGEKVYYSHKQGSLGGQLFGDVTNGYGPESFHVQNATRGKYLVQVHYYSGGSANFPEARGEVVVVLNEGRATETRHVFPYRLFKRKQIVTVAEIVKQP